MNRFLKYINIAIGTLVVAALGATWWYAWRPLPRIKGTMPAPVTAKVLVERDGQGVPHITAANEEDLFFAQGFAIAQDRLFQLELARRQAAGELAEVFGPVALESDLEARRLGMRRLAEAAVRNLPPADRVAFVHFARGVNHFIETHFDRLPVEFALARFDPAPWTIADSLLVGLQIFRSMTATWRDELLKKNLLASGDAAKVSFLFPVRTGAEVLPGSNAWAVAGRFTASGKPLLANDPHLGLSIPSVWYQVHLKAGSFNVAGVGLPGLPGVGIGHNQHIAWGITNLHYDAQDLYLEHGTPLGQWREVVRVRGGSSAEMIVPLTRHGPVFANEGSKSYALRWAAAIAPYEFPMVELNHARNWREFRAALARFPGPGFNFVYADREGNIGYQVAGKLPVRKDWDGDVPQEAASGHEWEGFIPFDDLPSQFNPPSGMVITANQNPFPPDYRYRVSGNFSSHYRSRQIQSRLTARSGWKPDEMLSVQTDIYSAFTHLLARQLVAACTARKVTNPALVQAVKILAGWDGRMEANATAPFVVTLAFQHLRKAVAEKAAPGKGALYDIQMAPVVIERLLRERPADWFTNYDQLLVRVLDGAMEEGVKLQGRNAAKWSYGQYNQLTLKPPAVSEIPWIGKYFQIGPVAMNGSQTTVMQVTPRLGPSMRFVADLADWDASRMNLPMGQSGHPLSSHHGDQWKPYYAGTSLPMQFVRVEVAGRLELVPQ